MSEPSPNPVLARVRAKMQWPEWESWHEAVVPPEATAYATPVDHRSREFAVRRRLDRARTIAEGGPYVQVFTHDALARLEAERGQPLGPLASFTFAIKDLVAVEGRRCSAGSAVRADAPPESMSAPIVSMLEQHGAVAVGTVTLHEFAFGTTGVNDYAGTALNPAAPDRLPGGSSSGSAAAVADGSARVAIGTDTGGSVRIPASFCGVVGFKPSFGTYPSAGVFPLSGTLDHVGFLAADVADIIAVHMALCHVEVPDVTLRRIGVARADLDRADPDVAEAIETALRRLAEAGCELVDVPLPDPELAFATSTAIMFSEAAAVHASSVAAHPDRYGADLTARFDLGAALTPLEVAAAHEHRRLLIDQVGAALAGVDCIVGPTTPMVAPLLSEASDPALPPRTVANTRLANVVGLPAMSIPLPVEGPPVGLQLMGVHNEPLLAAAAAVKALVAVD